MKLWLIKKSVASETKALGRASLPSFFERGLLILSNMV